MARAGAISKSHVATGAGVGKPASGVSGRADTLSGIQSPPAPQVTELGGISLPKDRTELGGSSRLV